jgi:hypothetical protein
MLDYTYLCTYAFIWLYISEMNDNNGTKDGNKQSVVFCFPNELELLMKS